MKSTGLALLIAGTLVLGGCSEGNTKKKSEPPPVPVTAVKAGTRDVPVLLQIVGRAEAFESVALKSRVDGQVSSVQFTEGQHVKQGDILVKLDPTDFVARLQQAEAVAARDEALIAKTRSDTARYTELKQRNFVSEEKVNDIRTNEATANANLRASKAAAEVARLQLSYTTIRAPITGIVGARVVFPGSAVKTNETILAVVNRVRPLLVGFSVPEKYLGRIRSARTGEEMKVNVSVPSDKAHQFEGRVRFLDNTVDPATGTILMKAELPNEEEKFMPGQFLNVSLVLETLEDAVTIPSEALQQGTDGSFVFVVKSDNTVEVRNVGIAASNAGMIAIAKGLVSGETVVTDGQLRLTPGTKVRIKESGERAEKAEKPAAMPEAGPSAQSPANAAG
ncbi:efflux RND transporter periplasmic adaptor subunit [Propionivibrio soli]|uniref:efflux RND transporter periplasmic adaptor subunit n=1 Tax=Propionivibrio soli TaxID=2976531 RepID=UPI0021E82536|nr:efflux RND transporter periplasmic adaptor subunit [Propionivibrio soli]